MNDVVIILLPHLDRANNPDVLLNDERDILLVSVGLRVQHFLDFVLNLAEIGQAGPKALAELRGAQRGDSISKFPRSGSELLPLLHKDLSNLVKGLQLALKSFQLSALVLKPLIRLGNLGKGQSGILDNISHGRGDCTEDALLRLLPLDLI